MTRKPANPISVAIVASENGQKKPDPENVRKAAIEAISAMPVSKLKKLNLAQTNGRVLILV